MPCHGGSLNHNSQLCFWMHLIAHPAGGGTFSFFFLLINTKFLDAVPGSCYILQNLLQTKTCDTVLCKTSAVGPAFVLCVRTRTLGTALTPVF